MQCSRANWKLRVAAQLLAAGVLLAAPAGHAHPQLSHGFSPGLIDTLTAIAGAPRAFAVTALEYPYLAKYYGPQDSIAMSTVITWAPRHVPAPRVDYRTRISPDWVLAHEFGHRYDARRCGRRPCRGMIAAAISVPGENGYANTSAQERFAEAFANAIDYLRYTGALGRHDTESLLQREWYVPGTFEIVKLLLEHRIYRKHPINTRTRGGSR